MIEAATDYTKQLHFDASPDEVFAALTTLSGLAAWWAPVTGSGNEGGELRFTFSYEDPLVIDVERARSPSSVVWSVRACTFLPDWVGTSPSFTLSSTEAGGCELQFRHKGLTPKLECYGECSKGWDDFLPRLHDYVENKTAEREIVIDAPQGAVFAALSQPEEIVQWWGDDTLYHTTVWDHDLRVGGPIRHAGRFVASVQNGREFAGTGVYRVVDPPRVLEYTRTYAGGIPIPEETVIRYELDERDGRTRVRVVHSGFHNADARNAHSDHWATVLGWLSAHLSKE